MKVLIVFLLVFSLQFPAIADCPLPSYNIEIPPLGTPEPKCPTNPLNDSGCIPWSFEGVVGSWSECLDERTYVVYFLYDYFYDYVQFGSTAQWHAYQILNIATSNGEPFADPSIPYGSRYSGEFVSTSRFIVEKILPLLGTIVHPEYECWCPPPVCVFPQCIGEEISQKFPFDIFLNIPVAAINCPSLTFFGQLYDLCWLYELLRWFKYPIAVSLLIKLAMHL